MQPTRLNWIETQQDLSAQREELRRQLVVADTWQRAWMQKSDVGRIDRQQSQPLRCRSLADHTTSVAIGLP